MKRHILWVIFVIYYVIYFPQHVICDVTNNEIKSCNLDKDLIKEIKQYQPVANLIIDSIVNGDFSNMTYNFLSLFVDKFGNRMAGTENLEQAIDYMLDKSKKSGFVNVHGENASVPYWIRGNESVTMLHPRYQELRMLGLGTSVGTPPDGIAAEVVVVDNFDQLHKLGDKVSGKIVLYNPPWVSYGVTVAYRVQGASEAAKQGAVAALVRSITPMSLDTPHTGHQEYDTGVRQIPVACITPADANMISRMTHRGETVVVRIKMEARNNGSRTSRNTVAELLGGEMPEKVVVLSGHLDSWDVGQGAMDDAAGALLSWNSALLLKKLKLTPRRTIRVILWTGEEQGYVGADQYVKKHANELNDLNFVMESDSGTFTPLGLEMTGMEEAVCIVQEILNLLSRINTTVLHQPSDGGPDISIWTGMGVPGANLLTRNEQYYWYHHSAADTMDIENPADLDLCTALWATVAYVVADLSVDIPKKLNVTTRF